MGIIREQTQVRFSQLSASTTSRSEVVVTFLALLELIRLRMLGASQSEAFGEIVINLAAPVSAGAAVLDLAAAANGEHDANPKQ